MSFFFLFFLHGTSIGNGQQGISYNDLYWRRQRLEFPLLNQVQLLNSIPKVQFKHICFAFANTLLYAVYLVN